MKITTDHARRSYGIPVVLDDRGRVMDPAPGVRAVLAKLGWTQQRLADESGVSLWAVEKWLRTGIVPANALNVLRDALERNWVEPGK